MLVSEIQDEGTDAAGVHIIDVYARHPPYYAVYRTEQRVMVHFADDDKEARRQSALLAPLNPVRGEINGLIDDWRLSNKEHQVAKARRYDRRIADALVVGLENDVPGSLAVFNGIKADIIDERTSSARLVYVGAALLVSGVLILAVWAILTFSGQMSASAWLLWFSLAGGTIGAFFSIAIAIRNRTVLTDLHLMDNTADAALRVVIGAIAAGVLVSLVKLGAISLTIGSTTLRGDIGNDWLYGLVLAFAAGFSERLIPDLLEKSTAAAGAAAAASQQASLAGLRPTPPGGMPGPQPVAGPAAPEAPSADEKGRLQEIRNDLQATRQIIGALKGLGVGSQLLSGADVLAGSADQMLGTIDKALKGGTGAPAVVDVAGAAEQLLSELGDVGLPGVLGGATSVLGSAMKVAGPAIAGLPGGPVGVVAGLVMGGLQVLSDERKFNAWKTALLAKPFDRSLLPATVDGNAALLALELSPLMSKRLEGAAPNVATELLRACVTPAADGDPRSSGDLTHELLSDADPLGLRSRFASEAELSEALDEYRAGAIFIRARDELSGQIAIPALAGGQAASVDMGTLLTGAFRLREDPRAGEALEKIVYLVQALGALHLDPNKLANLVQVGLKTGAAMVGTSRTAEDPHNGAP